MIRYSIETLYHFACDQCKSWFSIGDWKPCDTLTCPKCGVTQEVGPLPREDDSEVPCKTHPDAPHGFDRNASASLDRYVCECEWWTPPEGNQ